MRPSLLRLSFSTVRHPDSLREERDQSLFLRTKIYGHVVKALDEHLLSDSGEIQNLLQREPT
jgi:hypothetical protein